MLKALSLAAEVISFLLQPKLPNGDFPEFVRLVCNFYEGRGGNKPSKGHINEANKISTALKKFQQACLDNKKINKNSLIWPMLATYEVARVVELTGNPDTDWDSVRAKFDDGECKRLKDIALESRNLRLLGRGTQLRASLSEKWRDTMAYSDALEIVRRAFVQEHFATAWRPESGVVVMNMHKAKGKQFDEVIIFEGWTRFADRIVRGNNRNQDLESGKTDFSCKHHSRKDSYDDSYTSK